MYTTEMPSVRNLDGTGMNGKEIGPMKIVFASGKGGTGKTTVAVNLAYSLASSDQKVQYLDCDVEEPNGHLFLKPEVTSKRPVKVMVPVIDENKCTFCRECGAHCEYKAIVNLPSVTMIFPELCHSCGLCLKVCSAGAIREEEREVGYTEEGTALQGIEFIQGVLNVGEPMATPVIKAVKSNYKNGYIQIIDAPPGTSCPAVKTMTDADFVVLVTEPTPFGLHDLKIAVSVARDMDKPVGVVVNREQGNFMPLENYLSKENIPLLMGLPEDRRIAESYSRGEVILKSLPEYHDSFVDLFMNIMRLVEIGKTKAVSHG
jgi:MinD superfamily P-loop ATPase